MTQKATIEKVKHSREAYIRAFHSVMECDDAYHAALVAAYGKQAAGTKRYEPRHDNPAARFAREAFTAATARCNDALDAMRALEVSA